MKDEKSKEEKLEKNKNENQEISRSKTMNSPKKPDKKSSIYFSLSPEYKFMDQKYFPTKEKFFGVKTSPEKINLRSYSPPSHSAILNYYSINPQGEIPHNFAHKKDNKTLQDKIEPFVKDETNNNGEIKNNLKFEDDEEEEESNEDAFMLSINNINKNDITEPYKKNENNINSNNEDNSNNIILNESIKSEYLNDNKSKSNTDLSNHEISVKDIINKSEFKPYIPNIYRNLKGNDNKNFYNNYSNISPNYNTMNNYFSMNYPNNNIIENQDQTQNFFYKGDHYQINTANDHKKNENQKPGEIRSITEEDSVITITSNNKVIKRINPTTYLNESIEFLSFNILILAQDQAGCRFLQEKIESDPGTVVPIFYKALIPHLLILIKDHFGNYLIQKIFQYLNPEDFKTILNILSPEILNIGSDIHGTRVIQNLVNYLSTPELVNLFLSIIKPYLTSLLKEMQGVHIIDKFISSHPECEYEINKIIVDNCSLLATHKHACFFLQNIIELPNKPLKSELIKNLIDICSVLIIDQFGNYIIQTILELKNNKYSSDITLIISDNAPYYSKHRYSCNVIEKCFDICGKKEKNILIEKLSSPQIISELILDDHGNYVIQKVLNCADNIKREEILNVIKPLIPKIKETTFGEKLLDRLYYLYPILNNDKNYNKEYQNNWKNKNYGYNKNKKYHKKKNYNYKEKFNNQENKNNTNINKNDNTINNQNINDNSNNIINNNNNNLHIENKEENEIKSDNSFVDEEQDFKEIKNNNNNTIENKKKIKKKKGKKKKKSPDESKDENKEKDNNNTE